MRTKLSNTIARHFEGCREIWIEREGEDFPLLVSGEAHYYDNGEDSRGDNNEHEESVRIDSIEAFFDFSLEPDEGNFYFPLSPREEREIKEKFFEKSTEIQGIMI